MSNQDWETPIDIYKGICNKLHLFPTLDVCATEKNTKCIKWFTREMNGLHQVWDSVNWCNPPYQDVWSWFIKGIKQYKEQESTTIFLTHYTLESSNFEGVFPYSSKILLIAPRINFYDPLHPFKKGNDRPSMITVIGPAESTIIIERWNYLEGSNNV